MRRPTMPLRCCQLAWARLALIFALQKDDLTRRSELLGSMGITALISANPVMGLSIVATTGYAYWKARSRGEVVAIDATSAVRDAALGATSAATFATSNFLDGPPQGVS